MPPRRFRGRAAAAVTPSRTAMTPLKRLSESAFMAQVIDLLNAHGWLVYHTYDSRRSPAGFPDLIAVRGGSLLAWELKMPSGRVTVEQRAWLQELDKVPGVMAAVVWFDDDLSALLDVIR